jgi:3-hydroxyisobutyrate dehydrogenase-like beta-hydroxyacid dehydrogenase
MNIAFLGTGIMGRPMAENLVRAGHQVSGWNRTAEKARIDGAQTAASPAEAAREAEVVWCCVSDTAAAQSVLLGPQGAIHGVRAGAIVADSSTIAPSASRGFAEKFRAKGVEFADCPMTGSKTGAERGELVFIAGGKDETIEALQPLFQAMGKKVFHIGGNGMGLAAKLAMNLNIALIYEGFSEGLVLAERSGVSAAQMLEIIRSTMLRSGVIEYKGPFIERRDFSPNFPLRLMLKDIHLMLEHARELRVKLPALETVEEVYSISAEEGLAEQDFAATLKLLEKWAGLPGDTANAAD